MRVTITIRDDTSPVTASRYAGRSIEHWESQTAQGKRWSSGAVIVFGSGIATSTKETDAGWVVWVWKERREAYL